MRSIRRFWPSQQAISSEPPENPSKNKNMEETPSNKNKKIENWEKNHEKPKRKHFSLEASKRFAYCYMQETAEEKL